MYFSTALLALLPLTALAIPEKIAHPDANGLTHLEARQALHKKPFCPKTGLHIIAGSGAGAPQRRGYGLLNSTVMLLRQRFPGTTNWSIPYEKTADPTLAPAAIAHGVDLELENIKWYTAGCPTTPVVLLGYSQGAMVTMNTLCGKSRAGVLPYGTPLDPKYTKNIIAVVVYGDETRVANQSYNQGTCVSGKGIAARANPAGCAAFSSRIHSYCDLNDPECCVGSPNPNKDVHYVYPSKYDNDAVKFIQAQFLARKGPKTY